jgi:hypothetical protein
VEAFVIRCTTCQARLQVHDARLVGDIIECPKCGSFVEIAAPTASHSATAAKPAPAPEKSAAKSSNSKSSPSIKQAPPPLPVSKEAAAPIAKPVQQAVLAAQLIVPEPPTRTGWFGLGIARLREHWLLASGGFAGGILAATILSYVLTSSQSEPVAQAPSPKIEQATTEPTPNPTAAATSSPATEVPATSVKEKPAAVVTDEPAALEQPTPEPKADDQPKADDSSKVTKATEKPREAVAEPTPAVQPALPETEMERTPVAESGLMVHLEDRLPTIDFKNVSLGQFVSFLSSYSTIPFTIDTVSLAEVGKSTSTRVSVKLTDVTVQDALKAALTKPKLEYRIEPDRIVIFAKEAK